MEVISKWSTMEHTAMNVVASNFPGISKELIEIYLDSRTNRAKEKILSAIIKTSFKDRDAKILEKLIQKQKPIYKLRNKLAHWKLGYDKSLPNCIVAFNAEKDALWSAAQTDFANNCGPKDNISFIQDHLEETLDKAEVITSSELQKTIEEINKIIGHFIIFSIQLSHSKISIFKTDANSALNSLASELNIQ